MCVEEMKKALDEIVKLYKDMEKEYGVNLATKVQNVEKIKEDIDEAIWYVEVGKNL